MVSVRILGQVEVSADSRGSLVRGQRQVKLLAVLILNANRAVSADVLVDSVWGETRQTGEKRLTMAIARLRQALEPLSRAGGPALRTVSGGYMLSLEPDELDAHVFLEMVRDGRAALEEGNPRRASELLREAQTLWRGPPLAEVAFEDFAQPEIRRLEELRVVAVESRIEADLQFGSHPQLIGELESLVAEYPDRERLASHLMLALYHSGRQADALDVYQRTRAHLSSEVGLEPGPALKRLQAQILEQDPALDAPAAGTAREPHDARNRPPALPSRLRVRSTISFVGRAAERMVLEQALPAAGDASLQAVLISGEPGIGKTRVVTEFAALAHERGIAVAGGRCDSNLGLPYQPFVEVLADLVARLPASIVEQHLRIHGTVLAHIAPQLTLGEPEAAADFERETAGAPYRVFVAVADVLRRAAAQTPLLIVLEDLHWADEPTIRLLKHVMTMPNASALTILGTFRSTDIGNSPLALLLPELHREQGIQRVTMRGLTEAEVTELVQEYTGEPLDEEGQRRARRLCDDTAGNPFFVIELLRAADAGSDRASDPVQPGVTRLPVSLLETITARVRRLGEQTMALLTVAAVAGDELDLGLLRALGTLPEPDFLAAVDAALDAELIADVPGTGSSIAFVHALVAQALRSSLSVPRRRALHRAVAEAMEHLYGRDGGEQIAALAHHWREGCEPPATEPAVRTAVQAAERALARLAPAEAVRWYQDALELYLLQRDPARESQCDLLIRLGASQRQAGEARFRETLLTAARLAEQVGDSDHLVAATLANTRGFTSATGAIDTERVELLEAALRSVTGADSASRARLLVALAVELAFAQDRDRPRQLSQEALAIARRCEDDDTLAKVLSTRFFAIWAPDTLSARLVESKENVQLCERLGDPLSRAQALHWRANACIEACDITTARHCASTAAELSTRLRDPTAMWQSDYLDASLALAAGELDHAEQRILKALEIGQSSGQPDALPVFAAQLTYLRFDQGRLDELLPLIERIIAAHPGITGFRALLALARCEQRQYDLTRTAFAEDASSGFAGVFYDVTWLSVICIYAHVCARLRDQDAARILFALLVPWCDQVATSVVAWGSVAHYLGMLATALEDWPAATDYFCSATRTHEEMGAPVWLARTHLEAARMHARRRDPGAVARSVELLEEAQRTARSLNCATLVRDAMELVDNIRAMA